MANNNETTTRFNVDIAELKKEFQEAKRQIRLANSEFKAATAGMDDWSKSADGLSAKINQLNTILEAEKQKLRSLEQQYEQVVAEQGENSRGAQELMIQINNQRAAVGSTERQISTYTSRLHDMQTTTDRAEDSVGDLDGSLGDMETAADHADTEVDDLDDSLSDIKSSAAKAGDGFTIMKGALANLVANGIRLAIDGLKKLGQGIIDVGKQSIANYAQYEQLVGGVETLFGESSKIVQGYANDAFKTAGLSANEYMETVTSFSASLLQGLDGDTAKAAKVADKAISDMSDNANKMGTDMGLIQNAYQGFAKQNYTMLDNLKLGYGGTQKEMARLINDSGVLGDSMKVTEKTVNDVSFDKIIEAIHVIQDEMGITGTTAKEAANTIEGSKNAMKSAWQNFLTGIADENSNLDVLFDNLIESVKAFGNNILPRIEQVVKNVTGFLEDKLQEYLPNVLPRLNSFVITAVGSVTNTISKNLPIIIRSSVDAFNQVIDMIIRLVPTLVSSLVNSVPKLIAGITQIVSKVVTSLGKLIPKIVNQVILVVPKIIDSLLAAAPELLNAAIIFLTEIVKAIPTVVTHIAQALPQIINTIVNSLNSFVPQLIEGTIVLLNAIVEAIPLILPPLIEALPQIIAGIVQIFTDSIPILTEATIMLFMAMIQAIPTIIEQLMPQIPMIIAAVIDALLANAPLLLEAAVTVFMEIANAIPMILQALWDGLTAVFKAVVDDLLAAFVENWLAGWEILKEHFAPVMTFFQNLITKVKNTAEKAIKTVRDKFDAAWKAIKKVWETAANFFVGVWNGIKNAFKTADTWFTTIFTNAWNGIKGVWDKVAGFFTNIWNTIRNYFSGDGNSERGVSGFFTTIFTNAWNNVKAVWNKVSKYFSDIWDNIVNTFSPVKDWISEQFNKAWDAISKVWDKVTKYFSDIWDDIVEVFTPVQAWISEQFNRAWKKITGVWDEVNKYFQKIWDGIVETFKGAKDWLSEQFTKAWNAISEVWNGVSDYFEKAKNHILGAFSGNGEDSLIGGIRKKFLDAWQAVKNIFSSDNVSYFFEGVISTITGLFSGLGDIVGNSVSESLKGAVNAMLDSAEWALNLLPGMFNKALQTITDISGKSFSLFGTVSLPRLAKGGVVTRSTLANIGEAGAEAIVPLENNTQWLDEIAKRLTTSMKAAGIAINAPQQPNVVNNNFYQTNNSPKALSRLEIYRQSKNLLQLRGGY